MKRIIAVLTLVVTCLLSTAAGSSAAAPAKSTDEAGVLGGCWGNICGSVINESSVSMWAIKDYDANGPKPGTEWRRLWPGDRTPSDQDWDGAFVQCYASGRVATWTFPGVWIWHDFSMGAGQTRKVSTDQDLHVRSQSC